MSGLFGSHVLEQIGTAYHASTWVERTAYANADGVIAVSEAMKHDVQTLYAVPSERIQVIHNGIDIHQNVPIPIDNTVSGLGGDPSQPGPIMLQDHGNPVQYRNIWLVPLAPCPLTPPLRVRCWSIS